MKTHKEKEIEEVIIGLVTKEIKECLGDLKSIEDGYEYEEKVLSVVRKIGAILITESMGELPESRNKKKLQTCLGHVEMSKEHPMAHSSLYFGMSPKLQELICLLGQGYVFEEGEEVLNKTLGLEISAKQIQRVSEHYGQVIEDQQVAFIENKQEAPMLSLSKKDESIYTMMDGSMTYTREHGWKEMKVGRLFSGHDCVPIQERRNLITQTIYVCDLGDHKSFFAKWDAYTDRYRNKICIADGAKWIWNWLYHL